MWTSPMLIVRPDGRPFWPQETNHLWNKIRFHESGKFGASWHGILKCIDEPIFLWNQQTNVELFKLKCDSETLLFIWRFTNLKHSAINTTRSCAGVGRPGKNILTHDTWTLLTREEHGNLTNFGWLEQRRHLATCVTFQRADFSASFVFSS